MEIAVKRRRVVVITIALLLLLDLGRSINARVGYATPAEFWQPNSAVYADLAWPPGRIFRQMHHSGSVSTHSDARFVTDQTGTETDRQRPR